jgi:hypothetical protein
VQLDAHEREQLAEAGSVEASCTASGRTILLCLAGSDAARELGPAEGWPLPAVDLTWGQTMDALAGDAVETRASDATDVTVELDAEEIEILSRVRQVESLCAASGREILVRCE